MPTDRERDFGSQPLSRLMHERGLKATDLVRASDEQLTHKAVARAMAGRWLTPHMRDKIRRALVRATGTQFALAELFTYTGTAGAGRPPPAA